MIPGEVLALIESARVELPGIPAGQVLCQGAKFHSPTPTVVHPFRVRQEEGEGGIVYLCGTCFDNVEVLLSLLEKCEGPVPWTVKRCFGNLVRAIADQAYERLSEENPDA